MVQGKQKSLDAARKILIGDQIIVKSKGMSDKIVASMMAKVS